MHTQEEAGHKQQRDTSLRRDLVISFRLCAACLKSFAKKVRGEKTTNDDNQVSEGRSRDRFFGGGRMRRAIRTVDTVAWSCSVLREVKSTSNA